MRKIRALLWSLYWFLYSTGLWGAYELIFQGYQLGGAHPIWSGTFGPPYPHHYIVGLIGAPITLIILQLTNRGEKDEENRV